MTSLRSPEPVLLAIGIILAAAMAWGGYIMLMDAAMPEMNVCSGGDERWTLRCLGLSTGIWSVMMAAMMLPTTVPMALTFAVATGAREGLGGWGPTLIFLGAYIAAWSVGSTLFALAQGGIGAGIVASGHTHSAQATVGASLVTLAGLYQLTPLKTACLRQCRLPLGFLLTHWRPGLSGALSLGLRHSLVCIGCCWALILLMLATGAMSIVFMAALTAFIVLEKMAPYEKTLQRCSGYALIIFGVTWFANLHLF